MDKNVEYIEFIDWIRKNSLLVEILDKKSKKKFNLERWIVEIDGERKEIIKKVEIIDEREVNPTLGKMDYCCVPNYVTDSVKELVMYDKFKRKVLGRRGIRIEPNEELIKRRKEDIKKRSKLLVMLNDKNLILYRKLLMLKYRQFCMPSISTFRKWQRLDESIKQQVNSLIHNYVYEEKSSDL